MKTPLSSSPVGSITVEPEKLSLDFAEFFGGKLHLWSKLEEIISELLQKGVAVEASTVEYFDRMSTPYSDLYYHSDTKDRYFTGGQALALIQSLVSLHPEHLRNKVFKGETYSPRGSINLVPVRVSEMMARDGIIVIGLSLCPVKKTWYALEWSEDDYGQCYSGGYRIFLNQE